jgi:Uma2 family endonuclease
VRSIALKEFEKLPEDENLHELDEGELIVMPPRMARHGLVQAAAMATLAAGAKDGSGVVVGRCGFRLAPDVVLAPDVAFIVESQRNEVQWNCYPEFGPDLAVEILSPDDNAGRLQRKVNRYLAAGTSIVWVLDPDSITVNVYESSGAFRP